jgi:hypothetical protein
VLISLVHVAVPALEPEAQRHQVQECHFFVARIKTIDDVIQHLEKLIARHFRLESLFLK